MKIISALRVASAAFFFALNSVALAQNVGTVANHAVPVGKGPTVQGFKSVGPCTTQYTLIFAGVSADPACGQVSLTAGVTGTTPVANGGTGTTTVLAALQAWGLQIPNLAHKAAPVGADKIGFYDVAGAVHSYATLTELIGAVASGVASFDGRTGAVTSFFQSNTMENCTIVGVVVANALTVAIKTQAGANPSAGSPCTISFRDAAATGGYTAVPVTAVTAFSTGASGSTFGSANAVPFHLYLVAINNGGTVVLGVINASTPTRVYGIDEGALLSSTACSSCTNATSAGVIYSTAAQTSKAIRVLGRMTWESGLVTAGTWASAPTVATLVTPGFVFPGQPTGNSNGMTCTANTQTALTTTSYVSSAATISLTPRSAANFVDVSHYGTGTVISGGGAIVTGILRGGTLIGGSQSGYNGSVGVTEFPASQTVRDFPQAATLQTWVVGARLSAAGSGNYGGVNTDGACSISAQEIQG